MLEMLGGLSGVEDLSSDTSSDKYDIDGYSTLRVNTRPTLCKLPVPSCSTAKRHRGCARDKRFRTCVDSRPYPHRNVWAGKSEGGTKRYLHLAKPKQYEKLKLFHRNIFRNENRFIKGRSRWNNFRSKIVSYETIFALKFGISKIVLGPKQFLPQKVYVGL